MGEKPKEGSEKSDKNTISDWKDALSGALNDTQLMFALVVLFIFFAVYTFFNSVFIDSNRKDVDAVKDIRHSDCDCKSSHKNFYIAWFTICSTMWVLGPFALWIFQWCNCCHSKVNCTNTFVVIHKLATYIADKLQSCNSKKIKEAGDTILKVHKLFKIDKLKGGLKKIEDLKWLEYYNMHITGSYIKKIKFKKIKKGIMEAIGPITNDKPKQASHDKDEEKKDFMDGKADSEGNYCCSGCSYVFCLCVSF